MVCSRTFMIKHACIDQTQVTGEHNTSTTCCTCKYIFEGLKSQFIINRCKKNPYFFVYQHVFSFTIQSEKIQEWRSAFSTQTLTHPFGFHFFNFVYPKCKYLQPQFSASPLTNKRPMGHIAHLRKQFKSINTYGYIITWNKRRKTHYYLYEN